MGKMKELDLEEQQKQWEEIAKAYEAAYGIDLPEGKCPVLKRIRCECGVDKIDSGKHSLWCPKRKD